jgi:hypothetical protein
LLARAGYEVEALYGGWEGGPPTPEGEDMIWIATKRGVRRRTTRAHAGT